MEDEANFQMYGDLQVSNKGTKAIHTPDEGILQHVKDITPANEGVRELVLTEPDKVPCWEKFTEKSYIEFRKGWLHYVQNNGARNIKELTTIQCKFQSVMFYDDLFEKSNSEIIKNCDSHFGNVSTDDVVA